MEKSSYVSILDYFHGWVAQTPDRIAVHCGEDALTFHQLNIKADKLAHLIISQNSLASFVGLSATKSIGTIVGMLAIIKSGKAYLPLDITYPEERIRQMVQDAGVQFVVCEHAENEFFSKFELTPLAASWAIGEGSDPSELGAPSPAVDSELIALLYTSGSTGIPKGVCMTHVGMRNLIEHQLRDSKASGGSKNLLFSHLSFDASFQEVFVSLTSGGTLHVIGEDIRLDAVQLLKYIEQQSINRIFVPYVVLQYLTEAARNLKCYPPSLKEITTGGELLKITPAIREFFVQKPDCTLVNVYGPTETSIWVTDLRLTGNAENWPDIPTIGAPIDNADIFLLDTQMNEVAKGEVGEIYIGGVNVSKGYLNREELTRERYLSWKDSRGHKHRLYRTGDLGRFLPNGEIEFHGRADHQVKIRGNRVELGEIEICLAELPEIAQSVVVLREDSPGIKRLVAYLISQDGNLHDISPIREYLGQKLPNYMVPAAFVWLESFPKTTSGKVDRNAFPTPEVARPDIGTLFKKPSTEREREITALWCELLLIDKVGVNDNFFELGGNSLLAQQTVAQLRQRHHIEITVTKIYQYPTAAALAVIVDGTESVTPMAKRHNVRKGNKNKAIAIIGMAGKFPGAASVEELWDILLSGKETVKFFSDAELDGSIPNELLNDPDYVKARGIVDQAEWFDAALFGINPTMARLMDPQQRIFLEISRDVLEASGYLTSRAQHSIGVYAGTGNNTYFINNLQHHPEEIAKIGAFQVMVANEKDYIATRTAYQLDLKGPAVSLNTACSTSLVAISQAVEAIRNGQCDMAIAGGVSITVPIHSGQRYEEGAMFSTDGHTRPFDAQATGTVFSDGAGVVLLKDLENAKVDGDTIYAIISGVGLSNDGGGKGSFTAPSATGQAMAIQMAMDDSGFLPETIGYIEAHGTATPLGDPIEVEGLKLAFGDTPEKQFCRIGSIKSNMGHLTHAAGVAGLIKVALSLYHRVIPPSINFDCSNPNIDFSNSPFVVNERPFHWNIDQRLRAGVSSFGVGGTNAHVLLEAHVYEPTDESTPPLAKRPVLVNWSAKTDEAARSYAGRLVDFLSKNPTVPLDALSYTLQTTREDLNKRYAIVAEGHEELSNKLIGGQWIYGDLEENTDQLVFMFPGQGAQYINMGLTLYRHEPVYREAIDQCAEILLQEMGEDIRAVIFTDDPVTDQAQAAEILRNTYYTQPALFITSYATAKLWMSWGIKPTAYIGHSIGEFVAAHLAGVFSLKDALRLITTRGRLTSSVDHGSMLSVRAAADRVATILPAELSIAAINAPNLCVVTGPDQPIADFAALLESHGIACKPLHTSHAFHSSMMQPILEDFKSEVARISLHIPKMPIVSTVSGSWLKDEQATDPAYWAHHIVATVRFSEALLFLEQELHPIYLEAGPGQVTSTLAKQHGAALAQKSIGGLYAHESGEYYAMYQSLGQLWTHGIVPHWDEIHLPAQPKTIHTAPTYAHDRKYHWIGPEKDTDKIIKEDSKLRGNIIMRKDLLINNVKTLLEEASGIDIADAPLHATFIEIGFDSLLLTQIAQSLKKEFGLPITFRKLNEEYHNLNLLGEYLDKHLPTESYQPPVSPSTPLPQEFNTAPVMPSYSNAMNRIPQKVADTATQQLDPISLISQQISLISQQIALLQGSASMSFQQPMAAHQNGKPVPVIQSVVSETRTTPTDTTLAAEEMAALKKPFGATARIERQSSALNEEQERYLADLIARYVAKTAKSKAYAQAHRTRMADPRVVSGFKPATKEMVYSIVVNRSKGCRLWDIDGNEYIDALNGFGSNMLGYQPDFIANALHQQIDEGYEIGPQHEKAGEVCELICELTHMDRAALCNTGSEAVLGAMRIARTITGRSTIVAFSNSYHGIVDEVIVRGTKKLKTFPAASGIMPEAVQNMLILDYGTPESLQIIRERAHELAAVLVEPVQSRRPEFQPVEFVKELRKITTESGTALIFDEVITGFRMHLHGMQHLWGIEADLATYGKVVGSGMSVGVIAGKRAFMDALDGGYWEYGNDSVPEVGVTYFAGTFVRHPLALAATKASLEYLKAQGPQLQENLTNQTKALVDELNSVCQKYQIPLYIAQFGSLWKVKYHGEYAYGELLFTAMRIRGIHILDGFPCFLTTAHTDEDIKQIVHAFEGSVHELVKVGFIPTMGELDLDNLPPIANARLGKDMAGNPAWFIEDEQHPGKYLQVEQLN
ncbi:polyketide synthase [Parapedobacter tibetensis]|uniref:polyketide synthase n=1 Tax=Parapedobacter tibetensis TaxID=2972951 RepID=UPI00214D169A|nr:polyketide synthase [Parapedobacter tibetensis]